MVQIKYMQGWIGVVGLTALGNTISCYRGHDLLSEKLYTGATDQVNALMARLFGTWTLLAAILRVYTAFSIHNKGLYLMTLASFVLAFVHFISEGLIYKTAPLTEVGVIMPLVISGISTLWMLATYRSLFCEDRDDREPTSSVTLDAALLKARKGQKKAQ